MALHLAYLPNEILDSIFTYFQPREADITQARLIRCNNALRRRFEPRLYSQEESCDRIMRVACERGLIETIKLAVDTFGASPSLVTIWNGPEPFKVLTLHLAAKKMQPGAFALLLKLGARVDIEIDKKFIQSQMPCIVKALQVEHARMLHQFFISGTAAQVPNIPIANNCLVQAIINRALPETVRLLLDHGANPSHVQAGGMRLSALSAAAMTGAKETFKLLLEMGADVNAKKCKLRASSLFEVPIIGAAHAMAEFQTTEMLQLCLEYGASIDTNITLAHESSGSPILISPLTAYLDAVIDWRAVHKLSPFDAVSLILNQVHQMAENPTSFLNMDLNTDCFQIGKALESLLGKWGVGHFVIDEFFAVVWLLAENAGAVDLRSILKTMLHEPIATYYNDGLSRWLVILDVLLKNRNTAERSTVLYNLILDCANSGFTYEDESAEVLIDHLIQAGADINLREHGDESSRTVLHAVCDIIDEETKDLEQSSRWHFVELYQPDIDKRGGLLQTIVRKGGDPKLQSNGKDALDRLRRTSHEFTETRIYVSHLTGYLNCADRLMDDLSDFVEVDGLFVVA
ncbi:unnamed protein product [Clonostachys solani]|uniref:Uncharacterized protein n=1 Tax=Clonostachys solani TaxID=160281 RepID=A0A9N9VVV0_9HYPO|nr:unnamed protein product [Clonostachys solani]